MKTKVVVKAYDIVYDTSDTDGPKPKRLPKEMKIELDLCDLEDALKEDTADLTDYMNTWICDEISDRTGWCVESYEWCFC